MAKNVVFVIHGVGAHQEGWATADDGPVSTLVEAANAYPGFSEQDPLTNSLEFVEIRYDDIFDRVLGRWQGLAEGLADMPGASPQAIAQVRDAIIEYGDTTESFFTSHGMDVVFYAGFALVRRLVQLTVATKIMKTVAEQGTKDRRYAVLAHSLGTAVAHDAIHRMASTQWLSRYVKSGARVLPELADLPDDPSAVDDLLKRYKSNPFGPGKFTFDGIFMLANTSALLHGDTPSPERSLVRPRLAQPDPEQYMCSHFFNIDHKLDPIGKVKRFRAEEAWPTPAMFGLATDLFSIDHIHDVNVHGFSHYLAHPLVHRELFRLMVKHRFSDEDYVHAQERTRPGGDFPQLGDAYRDEDRQEELVGKLEGIATHLGVSQKVESLVELYIALDAIYRELREEGQTHV
ncbi:hypothetical protein [Marinobacter sp. CHS3-4]|uniref:hypothetical protein n=1 Tax=Marinobacter sp. CHS3-4 TaxID=3045174 RepID=UPI0024B5475D|nr:hypothetical protein [Marinobacter sp. CHS3-4]MDI9244724.1 hypothetical protein [Marinobacter sp. CHS3-4]